MIILFRHGPRVPFWPPLLLAHAAGIGLIHLLIQLHAGTPPTVSSIFSGTFTPCCSTPASIARPACSTKCSTPVSSTRIFCGWKKRCSAGSRAWPHGPLSFGRLSEILYAAYFSYYLMIGGVGLALLLRDRRQFSHFVSVISFVFYVCYLIYIFTPVVGPRILFPASSPHHCRRTSMPAAPPVVPASVGAGVFFQIMALDLSALRDAGRRLSQQPCGRRHRHGLFLLPLPAADSLAASGRRDPALHFHRLLPLPLRGGCPGRRADRGVAYSAGQPALLQVPAGEFRVKTKASPVAARIGTPTPATLPAHTSGMFVDSAAESLQQPAHHHVVFENPRRLRILETDLEPVLKPSVSITASRPRLRYFSFTPSVMTRQRGGHFQPSK